MAKRSPTDIFFLVLSIVIIGAVFYLNAPKLIPKSIVEKVMPDSVFYAKQQHNEMFRDLMAAHNVFQQGDKSRAIEMADRVFERGLIYFKNRTPDYNDERDRLIADRMLATASWLAGWNTYDPSLSEYYASEAYRYSYGLHGPTYFWTINHLFDIGSRRMEQNDHAGALNAYMEIVKTYRTYDVQAFSDLDRIVMAHVFAAKLSMRFREYKQAYAIASEIYPRTEGQSRKDMAVIMSATKRYK